MLTREDLNEAVETGIFLLPEVPGELARVSIPGVQGRRTAVSHPLANTIGAATLDEQTADATIAEVIASFAAQNLTFGWRVGPYSTPRRLGRRLLDRGFVPARTLDGLTYDGRGTLPEPSSHISIRRANPDDQPRLEALIRDTYPIHVPWATTLSKVFLPGPNPGGPQISTFLAFVDGQEQPAGMAAMFAFTDRPIVFLGGASVREEFRRQGIYSALVTHRLAAAKKAGAFAAVIQAVEASSAACQRLGFEKFCEIELYIWEAGGSKP
jgi:predicted N-acetyltransferase YhbS